MKEPNCNHKRTGRVTIHRPYDADKPYAATSVCDREKCRAEAIHWVQGVTGEAAYFIPDIRQPAVVGSTPEGTTP